MVKDRILVGRFGAPHGAGGELRLTSFTGVPGAIAAYKPLFDESGTRRFSILNLRPIKQSMFVAKIAGIGDRASAGALTNAALYVPRASLPDVENEKFYRADLIGLAATNEAGEAFGSVVNVLNFGGGDILEIACSAMSETLLLPFRKEIFPRVDIEAGHLTVVPPSCRRPGSKRNVRSVEGPEGTEGICGGRRFSPCFQRCFQGRSVSRFRAKVWHADFGASKFGTSVRMGKAAIERLTIRRSAAAPAW